MYSVLGTCGVKKDIQIWLWYVTVSDIKDSDHHLYLSSEGFLVSACVGAIRHRAAVPGH